MPIIKKISSEYAKDSKAFHTYDIYIFNLWIYHFEEQTANINIIKSLLDDGKNNNVRIIGFRNENKD